MLRQTQFGFMTSVICLPILIYLGNPAYALLTGMALTLAFNRKLIEVGSAPAKYCLQAAIILLGFKLNVMDLWQISASYLAPVVVYVLCAMALGLAIGYGMKVDRKSSLLMASGTAICGGTTIATLSPIIRATPDQTGAALGIVFLLNALALFTFPHIGHWLEMSQEQFGVWVALAIHDTSSVVATAQIYGDEAANIATTVKLGRTLWLIPMVLITSLYIQSPEAKMRMPIFIIFFILASAIGSVTALPQIAIQSAGWLSKSLLVIALFLIGTEISRSTLRSLKGRVLIQALALWLIVVPTTLALVMNWV